jgi:solute carrier family 26 protein
LFNLNYVAIGISFACLLILLVYEFQIKPAIAKKCRFPVPIQFILVVVGIVVAWSLELKEKHGLRVVGHVPTG